MRNKADVDRLAEVYANDSYEIENVYRLVIQPKSIHREFITEKHGFLFIIRGTVRININGTIYDLHSGSVFHAAPNMRMEAQVTSKSELEYYSVFYRLNKGSTDSLNHACNLHFELELDVIPEVFELLTILHQSVQMLDGIGKLRVKVIFLRMMHQVLMGYKNRKYSSSPNEEVIEAAILYIKRNYMNPLTLGELAVIHAMNAKRFSYYFHKYTGYRPIDYAIHYRMERACELLTIGSFSVSDIAASVGYANPLYFSRAFKKKFGVSPSAYVSMRNRHGDKEEP
ncbi:AraC family transcriptional regulator [Paenibacillus sp. MER 180]|uniref:helix-turn-helix domain-containing protein n=1 Tax=Paenibacillus sp. MER 180 TaxID=2939570 RepID=UPI00203D072E|nr:AraC family transcriptional regulator [Paenibacillus sp. MER 180]MCM3291413.1 AraC family transcriptional regulator [Paenibacillus sp. MER 180]